MEEKVQLDEEGKFTCFINQTKTEEIFKLIKEDYKNQTLELNRDNSIPFIFHIGGKYETYNLETIFEPRSIKIKFIDSNCKEYKGHLFFINDLRIVLKKLGFDYPKYFENGIYNEINEVNFAYIFLNNINLIKNIKEEKFQIDKEIYKKIFISENEKYFNLTSKQKKFLLVDLNTNMEYYQEKLDIKNELYIEENDRDLFLTKIHLFLIKQSNILNEHVFCFYGQYSSGKSTLLLFINFFYKKKSIYLNLKKLKYTLGNNIFWKILFKDILYLFIKDKDSKEEQYLTYIENFYNNNKDELFLSKIITNLIDTIKSEDCFIILDQCNSSLEDNIYLNLYNYLEQLDFNKDKIKIIICSSINDYELRAVHESNIFHLSNKFIFKFHYYKGTLKKMKLDLSDMTNYEKKILKDKFNNILLYKNLIKKNKNNITGFLNDIQKKIENKIKKFFDLNNIALQSLELLNVKNNINEILNKEDAKKISKYLPYKYFLFKNLEEVPLADDLFKDKFIISYYFPLIQDIFEQLIIENTISIFSGELKGIEPKVVGSLLELNFKNYCIKNMKKLNIDEIVQVERIVKMDSVISSKIESYNDKNILFIQTFENGAHYDLCFYEGKDKVKKICFIQVKKGYTNNIVKSDIVINDYSIIQENLIKNFNINPDSVYLCYISLVNDSMISKLKKSEFNEFTKTISLYNACITNNIKIMFYHPIKKLIYNLNKPLNSFEETNLNFFENNYNISFKANIDCNKHFEVMIGLDEEEKVNELINKKKIQIKDIELEIGEIEKAMKDISKKYEITAIFHPGNINIKYKQNNLAYVICLGFIINNNNKYICKYLFYDKKYYTFNKERININGQNVNDKIFKEIQLFVLITVKDLYHIKERKTKFNIIFKKD